ncbi:MAG: hypothetical protein GQE15_38440 [Archangiaceae bacterium]|nr:hypothetical protein [Archangiaceae bacterium]
MESFLGKGERLRLEQRTCHLPRSLIRTVTGASSGAQRVSFTSGVRLTPERGVTGVSPPGAAITLEGTSTAGAR